MLYLSELYNGPGDLTYTVCRLSDEYTYNFTSNIFEDNVSPAFQSMTKPSQGLYEGAIDDSIFASGVDYGVDYVDNILNKVVASSPLSHYEVVRFIPSGIYTTTNTVYVNVNTGGNTNNYTPPARKVRYIGTLKSVGG